MNYKITIERKELNPHFDAELERREKQSMHKNFGSPMPQSHLIKTLVCELTEEQYKAIKAEVFKAFE